MENLDNSESVDGQESSLEAAGTSSVTDESSLETSEDQTQYKSAVDTTLDEIRKLRIIDKELASANNEDSTATVLT